MTAAVLRACTVLLVDDEEANLDLLEAILEGDGYRSIVRTSDAREVLHLLDAHSPDLVLLDLHMPHRSGFQVLDDLRARTPADDYLPVLVLTADVTSEAKERALSSGARDFLTKPFDAVEVLLRVQNLLEARVLHRLQREARSQAEAAQARSALLAEVSRALGASLDGTTSLSRLPDLMVPQWADACSVHLLSGGEWVRLASAPGGRDADAAREPEQEWKREALRRAEAGEGSLVVGPSVSATAGATFIEPIRVQGALAALLTLTYPSGREGPTPEERVLVREIAARAGLALENARLFAAAEHATQARDRMLSVVAHDLRNPLAVVGLYGEMLLSMLPPEGDAYTRTALTTIHDTTARLQRMVADLLDVAAYEEGVLAVRATVQPLQPLLMEAESMLRPLALGKGVELVFEGDPQSARTPLPIDGARFIQLLSNLVGNALRFTPPGGAVVVSWRSGTEELELSVSDSGPGISAEAIPHVFSAFWQARDRERRGVGLGLWIARAIVDGHGGRIWVESIEGRGASFHFTLPRAREAGTPELELPAASG